MVVTSRLHGSKRVMLSPPGQNWMHRLSIASARNASGGEPCSICYNEFQDPVQLDPCGCVPANDAYCHDSCSFFAYWISSSCCTHRHCFCHGCINEWCATSDSLGLVGGLQFFLWSYFLPPSWSRFTGLPIDRTAPFADNRCRTLLPYFMAEMGICTARCGCSEVQCTDPPSYAHTLL